MSDKDSMGKLRLKVNLGLSNGQWDEGYKTHKRFDWNMHLAGRCDWMAAKRLNISTNLHFPWLSASKFSPHNHATATILSHWTVHATKCISKVQIRGM